MKVDVFLIEFNQQSGMFLPKDHELHQLAVQFAAKNLNQQVNFTKLDKVWAACEVGADGRPLRVLGLLGMALRADFPLCRFIDNAAVVKLVTRARSWLQDNYSARGGEAFIYISATEDESQRCPKWKKWLQVFKAEPAERYRIVI